MFLVQLQKIFLLIKVELLHLSEMRVCIKGKNGWNMHWKVMHYIWCQFWLRSIRKRAKQCWHDGYLQEGYNIMFIIFASHQIFLNLMEATCKLIWAKNIFSLSFVIIIFLEAFCINGYLCCISIYLIKRLGKEMTKAIEKTLLQCTII